MIRVELPAHLRTLAGVDREVTLEIEGEVTQRSVLDALEGKYPALRGTIRDHVTHKRRPFVRFFAGEEDLSHESPDAPLPESVAKGAEPLVVLGAIAGGCISLSRPWPAAGTQPSPRRCEPAGRRPPAPGGSRSCPRWP